MIDAAKAHHPGGEAFGRDARGRLEKGAGGRVAAPVGEAALAGGVDVHGVEPRRPVDADRAEGRGVGGAGVKRQFHHAVADAGDAHHLWRAARKALASSAVSKMCGRRLRSASPSFIRVKAELE